MDDSNHIHGAVRRMTGCVLVLILMWILGALLYPHNYGTKASKIAVTKVELQNIASALDKYLAMSNTVPAGDSAAMLRTLIGSSHAGTKLPNPRKANASGEMLDIWGTQYRIEIADQTNALIRSAGPNGRFGDKDDIYIRMELAKMPIR